jgi:hypothetical protein
LTTGILEYWNSGILEYWERPGPKGYGTDERKRERKDRRQNEINKDCRAELGFNISPIGPAW